MRLVYESLRSVTKRKDKKMNYIEQFMKNNGIEVNEEFYINVEGDKFTYLGEVIKFHFTENLYLVADIITLDTGYELTDLLLGKYKIEKIPQKPKSVWDLKIGDEYYYIDYYGEIYSTFDDCEEDVYIIKFGNAFLTREEAEHEVERRKCEAILLKYGTRDMMSISDDDTNKYFICFNNYVHGIAVNNNQFVQNQGTIYFKTKELAQKAIDEVGEERLKKYIFNVKE